MTTRAAGLLQSWEYKLNNETGILRDNIRFRITRGETNRDVYCHGSVLIVSWRAPRVNGKWHALMDTT